MKTISTYRWKSCCFVPGVNVAALLVAMGASGVAVMGCASRHPHAQNPHETLHSYALAIEAGRLADAYAMLSDDAKSRISPDAFAQMIKQNPQDAKRIISTFKQEASLPVVTATVQLVHGDTLLLRYESGKWRVDASVIDAYSQTTPRNAVASFVRAFEIKRYDILMRFVPDSKKPGLDASKLKQAWEGNQKRQMQQTVDAVKVALPAAKFEQTAGHATMAFGASGLVLLVQEHGAWKIEDFVQ